MGPGSHRRIARIGLVAGPVLAALAYLLPDAQLDASGEVISGLTRAGQGAVAVGIVMAVWWLTEAIPLEATGLLPIVLLPLTGALGLKPAAAAYANEVIFLFLGGMILGKAMEVWRLHERLALGVVGAFGGRPALMVLGLLAATAFVSMWVSNTASAIMMLPIAVSITRLVREHVRAAHGEGMDRQARDFATAAALAVAYGASIGGVGTLIGTPPTAQFAAFMRERMGIEVRFLEWIVLGAPLVLACVLVARVVLVRLAVRVDLPPMRELAREIDHRRRAQGPWNAGQRWVLAVFVMASSLWIVLPLLGSWSGVPESWRAPLARSGDAVVGVAAALLLFMLPVGGKEPRRVLRWDEAQGVPWGVLLIFGGGLALADALKASGADRFLASGTGALRGLPLPVLLLALNLACVFLSEVMSNTALAIMGLQIAAPIAEKLGLPPAAVLVAVTLGSSLAFMLPAGTPPNAIAFTSGHVTGRQMAHAGVWLNIALALVSTAVLLGAMTLGVLPGAR